MTTTDTATQIQKLLRRADESLDENERVGDAGWMREAVRDALSVIDAQRRQIFAQQQQIDRLTRAVQLLATPDADRTEVAKILEGE